MLYITLLDQFHPGIYSSQVIDVCDYLNNKHNAKIRVVAFLSIKELRNTDAKKKLKQLSPTAIVLPAFPKLKYFQFTSIFLFFVCLFTGERIAICRNVFCATMAMRVKKMGLLKKIVFDGRSAMTAEIGEYDVFPVDYLRDNVERFEKNIVNNADFRISVSNSLVNYWRTNFNYISNQHVVIPCTLDNKFFSDEIFNFESKSIREKIGFDDNDVVLIYSGSTAPWQSFSLLRKILIPILSSNKKNKILFLSKETEDILKLQNEFPKQVFNKWVEHKDVANYLSAGDYGILVREQSDTNKVASPVKFAEYLACGLNVIISENLGDYSEFVKANNCGIVVSEKLEITGNELKSISIEKKKENNVLALKYFSKTAYINEYSELLNAVQ